MAYRNLREGKNTNYGNVNNGQKQTKHKCCKIAMLTSLCCAIIGVSIFLAVYYLSQKASPSQQSSQLCIWNATNSSYVNGLYSSHGVSRSGYSMYSLPLEPTCNIKNDKLYLFNSMESIWTISSYPDNTSSSGMQGICTSNTITNVTKCNGLWQIPRNKPQREVEILNNNCPAVSCRALQLSYDRFVTNDSCIGIFQNKISDNLYQKGSSDIYLFFNPSLFRWACGNKNDIDGCIALNELKGYANHQSWYNAHELILDGQTINMSWSNGYEAIIECINTAQPTISPTRSPTDNPSISPTKNPTRSPTKSPTRYPTFSGAVRFGVSGWNVWILGYCLIVLTV